MLSRVAETIFWLGRYMERTDGMLQILRTNYISSQDAINDLSWTPLLLTYGELSAEEIRKIERDSPKVLEYLISDRYNGTSVYNNVRQSRENARAIQDHITKEVWQCLNDFYHYMRDPNFEKQFEDGDPVSTMDLLIKQGLLFNGTVKNTMIRDQGYTYLHLGKFLERAILTTDIVRINIRYHNVKFQQRVESPALRYLLHSLLGYEVYMKTYKGNFNPDDVLEMAIHNSYFPHSLVYSLYQLNKYFERLKPESLPESYEEVEYLIGKTMNTVKYSNVEVTNQKMVNNFLQGTRNQLIEIGNCLGKSYFGNT
ncbi:MAG: hypothetical protein JWQ40_2623 [Segetibacter sp.]|jgi:uncharacterized alpha-E superfamily protein|nr:hypothetical protein [Segetibacter sp.]